eukprot:9782609-Ditylum_brightwellii.AAC.1
MKPRKVRSCFKFEGSEKWRTGRIFFVYGWIPFDEMVYPRKPTCEEARKVSSIWTCMLFLRSFSRTCCRRAL